MPAVVSRRSSWRAFLSASAAAIGALTACGGGSSSDTSQPDGATATNEGGDSATRSSDGGATAQDAGSTDAKLDAVSPGTDGMTGGASGAVDLSVGFYSTCALLSGGTVECWGYNTQGGLGDGTMTRSSTPVTVSGLSGATAVSTTGTTGCALLSGGTVECWGDNGVAELGDGTMTNSPTPVAVSGLTGATALSAGGCAVLSGGGVQCWGGNGSGQLGIGTFSGPEQCSSVSPCSTAPVMVKGLTGATAISAGGATCALLSGGTVQCWGDNTDGQLGDGTNTGPESCDTAAPCATTPVAVTGLTGATAISVGGYSACAIVSGGSVWCWGDNTYGELGNGTMTSSSTPVEVKLQP